MRILKIKLERCLIMNEIKNVVATLKTCKEEISGYIADEEFTIKSYEAASLLSKIECKLGQFIDAAGQIKPAK